MDAKDEQIAKVAIKVKDTKELVSLDKTKTLKENIFDICKRHSIATPDSYGLRLLATKFQSDSYIEEATFQDISNGSELELVPSVERMVMLIFTQSLSKPINFLEFDKLKTDPVFLDTLVKYDYQTEIQRVIQKYDLTDRELSTCLITLLQLLKARQMDTINYEVLTKIIKIVKTSTPSRGKVLQYLVAMLNQILYMKKSNKITEYKRMIIEQVPISHLMKFCEHANHSLQVNLIKLVNTIVKTVKDDRKPELVKELRKQRDCIFKYVLKPKEEITQAMAYELYVYQTYILNDKYKASLDLKIDINTDMLNTFEEMDEEAKRISDLLDFQEGLVKDKWQSNDTITDNSGSRYSLATSRLSSSSTYKSLSSYSQLSTDDSMICYRTYENLSHYKDNYSVNYNQSKVEENAYGPGIKVTADRVTRMLAKILQIDSRLSRSAQNYHPLVFNTTLSSDDVVAELFSRTMWLLSKTRREMKAYTYEDFDKVLKVLERQIRMVLEKKPAELKELLEHMKEITASAVYEQWQKEKDSDWKYILENNKSLQELKREYNEANMKLIFQQRISFLQAGAVFPKLPEKKHKQQFFHVQLSDNMKTVHKCEYDEQMGKLAEQESFGVSKIRHVIIGKNCPHFKDNTVKQDKLAFSFQLEGDVHHNFLAKDEKTANYWIDGFNLLLGKEKKSEDYTKELNALTEMDCALQLLELQDTHLFSRPAPPIPPLPPKPELPPKPHQINRENTTRSTNVHA